MRGSCAAACCLCVLACGPPPVFECDGDASCGPDGKCEPVGYCSFPDADCASGRRFGALASAELANDCVGQSEGTGESGMPGTTTTGSSTTEAATTSSSTGTTEGVSASSSSSSGSSSESSSGSSGGPLADGLVLHLPLDDDFTEGALDESGNALHASCDPCPTSVRGRVGMAAGFAADAVLVVADDPLLRPMQAFTLSVWALDADPSSMVTQFVAGKVLTGITNTFQLSTSIAMTIGDPDQLVWRLTEGVTGHPVYTPSPLAATEWHHLLGVWDGMVSTLYVDGEFVGMVEAPAVSYDAGPFTIGADNNDGMFVYWYRGAIDEVRFYDRALTPEEIGLLASM